MYTSIFRKMIFIRVLVWLNNFSLYSGDVGFHLYGAEIIHTRDEILEGLFIFEGNTGRNVGLVDPDSGPYIKFHEDTGDYSLYRPDGTRAYKAVPTSSGLADTFYGVEDKEPRQGLSVKVRPAFKATPWRGAMWKTSPHDETLIVIDANISANILKTAGDDVMVQILDYPYYRNT